MRAPHVLPDPLGGESDAYDVAPASELLGRFARPECPENRYEPEQLERWPQDPLEKWTPEQLARWTPEQLEDGDRFRRRFAQARELYDRLAAERKLKPPAKVIPIRPDTK